MNSSEKNIRWWDERAGHHFDSKFYNVESVINGELRLNDYEISEVGDVREKKLLHLQCHIGVETIAWARLGAEVTGIDFSQQAVDRATSLAKECGVQASFVCSDVLDATSALSGETFDVIYVSIGSLHWLPDIDQWARTVKKLLNDGGQLYVNEFHPVAQVLSDDSPTFKYDYFDTSPRTWNEQGSYIGDALETNDNEHVIWDRPLSDIIMAIINAGLTVTAFKERPCQDYIHDFKQFPYLVKKDDGRWYVPSGMANHPSTFSLKAVR